METGRQSAPTRSSLWAPPTRSLAVQRAATSGASPAGVADAVSERYALDAHRWPAADVRSCAARPAPRSVPHAGCASCPPGPMTAFGPDDRAKVSAPTSGADLRSTGPTTLSSQVASPCQHEELALALAGRWLDPLVWDTVGWARADLAARAARTGEELGAATGAQARTAGLRGCASPLLASRPRSASHREAEVLALVAEGRTNRQIGQALFITPKTASIHVSRILASWESPVAGRRPRSLTASASTSDDPRRPLPLFVGVAADAADQSAASSVPSRWPADLGIPRFWLLLGRVDVSTRSNALYDRCATELGVPEVSQWPANVLVREP